MQTKESDDYASLNKRIDDVSSDLSTFKNDEYATTKTQVTTNKNDISSLATNFSGLSRTEKTHYNELTKKVEAITADRILSTLGLKVISEGALCYVTTSD